MASKTETKPSAHAGLGYLLLRKKDWAGAEREFSTATEAGSEDPRVWYLAAYCGCGDFGELVDGKLLGTARK